MNRIENIERFASEREKKEVMEQRQKEIRIEEYKEKIRSFKSRIDELIEVGNACLKNGIKLEGKEWGGHEDYDTHQFITNSWSHLLGFVGEKKPENRTEFLPIKKLGIYGGGCCYYNLETDGVTIYVSGKEAEYVLKRFVTEFDKFEKAFYEYVDKVTG